MGFWDLDYGMQSDIADRWLIADGEEEQAALAQEVGNTRATLERHLQIWRKAHVARDLYEEARGEARKRVTEAMADTPAAELLPQSSQAVIRQAKPRKFRMPHVTLSAAVFDIEVTDFGTEGYSGRMICTSVLPIGTDTVTTCSIRFDEHGDDRRVLRETIAALRQYDILIGHNIAAFDLNWLHSRWLYHNARGSDVGDWPRWVYIDTYQLPKSSALKTRKSLGNLGDYFGLGGTKTSIYKASWSNVSSIYEDEFNETMAEVIYHCEQDVLMNRDLFDVIWNDALSMRNNPLKVSKWGFIPGVVAQGLVEPQEAA